MSEPKYYAHTKANPDGTPAPWQPLDEHLKNVAKLAAGFAESFGSSDWAYNAGLLHDMGKAHPVFQARLLRENGLDSSEYDAADSHERVNHSGAGAIFAKEQFHKIIGKTLAYAVAGHHAGLPDWHGGGDSLSYRLKNEEHLAQKVQGAVEKQMNALVSELRPPEFAMKCMDHDAIAYHLWVRMLFSCLVDADFLDTEAFMDADKHSLRTPFTALPDLRKCFDDAYSAMKKDNTQLNRLRADIHAACIKAAELPPGLFSLTVPTGGGKTISGTAFALEHAIRYGKKRIIYVIPYTSIIEQTADVLRRFFGADNVVEHHSNLGLEKETPRLALAAENWDAPVIVTTSVQFFESLYAARPGRCRKLHNLVNSVIFLDEAQLLPPEKLYPCVEALNRLVADYSATVVLSTATQPALPNLSQQPREIIQNPADLYKQLKRVEIHFPADLNQSQDWPTLGKEIAKNDQVLCVVNSRADCRELWQNMPQGTIHLSALMCGQHRSEIIAGIKKLLDEGKTCRVVSTQLVEAGVDIDFPVVYRALAGLDSLNQAAGRCNREGKLSSGEVYVFVPPKPAPLGQLRKGEDTTRGMLLSPGFVPDTPDGFYSYFKKYYSSINDMGKDWLCKKLVRDVNPDGNVQFRTAADEFNFIDEPSTPIIVRYKNNDRLIEELRFAGPKRKNMRALQRYTVTVRPQVAARLKAGGFLEEIHDGILVQADSKLYDEVLGLNISREAYNPEDLCV
jgi:CRISPR-associated endonuclease/helicase Cas3